MTTFLPRVDKPHNPMMKMVYALDRRTTGKVTAPIAVFAARMPIGFGNFYGKLSRLDKKLTLPRSTVVLIRHHVATINTCLFCIDATRWFALRESEKNRTRFDALADYQTSPQFTEAEKAALDYATELTQNEAVRPDKFARLQQFYNEREICEIVWLVASEHIYNLTNRGLGIGSEGLCELPQTQTQKTPKSSPNQRPPSTATT